jgi:heme A synthase
MKPVHMVVGLACIVLVGAAGLWGAWCWYRVRQSPWFWRLLRVSQVALVVQAALGGILVLMGNKPSSLHLIYGLLPLGISFVAEQLRIASAQMILDSRGFESSAAVGKLPESEQRVVVLSILQRELGVMVLAALVILVLLIRAAGTGG